MRSACSASLFQHVADAGEQALVEQRVADLAAGILRAQRPQHPLEVEVVVDEVLAEAAQDRVQRELGGVRSSSTGPSKRTPTCSAVRSTSQARRGRAAPALAGSVDVPAPAHAQVRVQRQAVAEGQQQVLAAGLDPRELRAGQPLRDAVVPVTRMRRLDLQGLACERLEPSRGQFDRVTFRHGL